MRLNSNVKTNNRIKEILHLRGIHTQLTLRTMAPPVEWPKQKYGNPGFSVKTLSKKATCVYQLIYQNKRFTSL